MASLFDELIDEASAAPVVGWDFGWLAGRATEERPSWRYSSMVAERIESASVVADLQSGGAEMLSGLPRLPRLFVATERFAPNLVLAACRIRPRGVFVVAAHDDRAALPFASDTFDLVTSRHPVDTWWTEIARLRPGGTYLSQQVGPRSVHELSERFLGPLPPGSKRDPRLAVRPRRTLDSSSRISAKHTCGRPSTTSVPSSPSSGS